MKPIYGRRGERKRRGPSLRSDRALRRWQKADATIVVRVDGAVVAKDRPAWAAAILTLCCQHVRRIPMAVRRVIRIGNSRRNWRWRHAHVAFNAVRRLTLRAEKKEELEPADFLLYVAENAAKVIYNASDPIDPFDDDSGEALISTARVFCQSTDDPTFARQLWETIVSRAQS